MIISIAGKDYEVPDVCPSDAKERREEVARFISAHGLASLLTSAELGAYAPCVLGEPPADTAAVETPEHMADPGHGAPEDQNPSDALPAHDAPDDASPVVEAPAARRKSPGRHRRSRREGGR